MAIYKRGAIWWMDVYVGQDRRRIRKSTGCKDITQARLIEQAAVAVNKGITTRQRAMAIVDAVLPLEGRGLGIMEMQEWYRNAASSEGINTHMSPKEWRNRLNTIGRLAIWLNSHTRIKWVQDIDGETAWSFVQHIGAGGVSAKTQNNQVGHLRTVWAMMMKHNKANTNPWENARVRRNPAEEAHGRAFSQNEIDRILAAAKTLGCEWEGVITVALYTGLRKRDVECLTWSCVDMDNRVIRVTPSKTAKHRISVAIPMHEKVYAMLSRITRSSEYVFPWRASHPIGQKPKKGDHFFNEILEIAGIKASEGEKITFHCLRHTFVSRLAEAGVAQDIRMRLAGHTSISTHSIYNHDDVSGRKAIDLLL